MAKEGSEPAARGLECQEAAGEHRRTIADAEAEARVLGIQHKLHRQTTPDVCRMGSWRAGCGESRTSGSEGGPEKPTDRKVDRALWPDPYCATRGTRATLASCDGGHVGHDALEVIRVEVNRGRQWVLDADIKACFDNIDHDALIAQVARRVSDRDMLKLLRGWLRAGVFEGGIVSDTEAGTPQGSPISPLLANIALHVVDEHWASLRHLGTLVRYADDLVVLCHTRQRAEQARERVAAILAPIGLQLHPDKTTIVSLAHGREGFDFLGFHHRMRTSWKRQGRYFLNKWPSARAMASIRAKVRARTDRRYASFDLGFVVGDLNPVLRGWGNYFRRGNSTGKFHAVDMYVAQRMARLASIKHGLRGINWTQRFNYDWFQTLGVHRLTGTVGQRGAHA